MIEESAVITPQQPSFGRSVCLSCSISSHENFKRLFRSLFRDNRDTMSKIITMMVTIHSADLNVIEEVASLFMFLHSARCLAMFFLTWTSSRTKENQ